MNSGGAVGLRARRNAETATCARRGRRRPLCVHSGAEMQIHTHTRVLRSAFYTRVNTISMASCWLPVGFLRAWQWGLHLWRWICILKWILMAASGEYRTGQHIGSHNGREWGKREAETSFKCVSNQNWKALDFTETCQQYFKLCFLYLKFKNIQLLVKKCVFNWRFLSL